MLNNGWPRARARGVFKHSTAIFKIIVVIGMPVEIAAITISAAILSGSIPGARGLPASCGSVRTICRVSFFQPNR